jgi:uncharacterized protein YybS (DUF2232 family)
MGRMPVLVVIALFMSGFVGVVLALKMLKRFMWSLVISVGKPISGHQDNCGGVYLYFTLSL